MLKSCERYSIKFKMFLCQSKHTLNFSIFRQMRKIPVSLTFAFLSQIQRTNVLNLQVIAYQSIERIISQAKNKNDYNLYISDKLTHLKGKVVIACTTVQTAEHLSNVLRSDYKIKLICNESK